ncbi:MAG: PDZ domain-containing protein [Candidatus Acidiferrales bacterium]
MRHFAHPGLAAAGILLLVVVGATQSAFSQSQQQVTPPQQATSNAAPSPSDEKCQDFDRCMKQMEAQVRTIEKEIEAGLPELERAAKEVEMSSPELSRLNSLSAKLQARGDELASRAAELSAHAGALAQQVQEDVQEKLQEDVQEKAQQDAQEKVQQEHDKIQQNIDRVFSMSPSVAVSSADGGGWLGVEIAEVTAEKAKDLKLSAVRGVIVDGVEPDSPAAKAGIKEKDVITQYDGQPVEGAVQFRRLIRETPPGRSITLEISRGGSLQNISVELGDRTDVYVRKMKGKMRDFGGAYSFSMPNVEELPDMPEVMDSRTPVLGINAEDLTSQLGSYFGAPNNAGVLVREVRPGTPADKAGLKAGDVITKVEGKEVRTLADLRAQLREKSNQASVNMSVLRKGSEIAITVPIEKPRPMEQMHSVHRAQL